MAKISRYSGDLKAFASAATGTNRTVFGSTVQANDLDSNVNSDFLSGWEIVGVNENPTKQDFNAFAYTSTQLMAYLHQIGVPEWSGTQEYHIGSIANLAGILYACKTNSHKSVTSPSADATNWERAFPATGTTAGNVPLVNQAVTVIPSAATVILGPTLVNLITGGTPVTAFSGTPGVRYKCMVDDTVNNLDLVHAPGTLFIFQGEANVSLPRHTLFDVYIRTAENSWVQNIIRPIPSYNLIDENTFATNSATRPPSQKSTKTYIASQILNEADFVSNSATKAPSQQSTKTYVDAHFSTTTVTSGGDFTSGTLYIARVGNVVTITYDSHGHASADSAISAVGIIPVEYRHSYPNSVPAVNTVQASGVVLVGVSDDGRFWVRHINWTGGATTRTYTDSGSISYVV
ncbi:MAG: hypothetical protein P1P89_19685 [Desulfobacterales bacterium]|nr:hypothetical protein [Desulfobacterales bacterium]